MIDDEVLLGGSSVVDAFAVSSARRKRVEVSDRKLTGSDRKLFRKAKELELQSWLVHECLIWSRRSLLIKRESCARGGS